MRTFGTIAHDPEKKAWHIGAEPHVAIRMKRIFGKAASGRAGQIVISDTPENCRDLEWFLQRYAMDCPARDVMAAGARSYRETILTCEKILGPDHPHRSFGLALPARDYQATAAELLLAKGSLLLADELGLGKSIVALAAACDRSARPALIVVPASLQRQWLGYCEKFAPGLPAHIIKRVTPYELPKFFGRSPELLICSYHKLAGWQSVLRGHVKLVIFDECQELRRPESLKYQAAAAIAGSARYRLGLSATPIYNYGGEFFHVNDVLCPGELGSRSEFNREWCVGYTDKPRISDPAGFGSYVREKVIMLRRTRAEVGRELPPVLRIPHTIGSDAREMHKVAGSAGELARIILDRTATKDVRWTSAGQFDMLLRQATGLAKAPYVADFVRLLTATGEQVILAGWHRAVYDVWGAKLSDLNPAWYTGSESPAQKDASKRAFVGGKSKVLFMSLRTAAGVDGLQQACSTLVFGELDWSPGVHEQCIGRLHRDGVNGDVRAYYLVSEDGSDPVVADVLGLKREQIEGLRDPHRPAAEPFAGGGHHVKALAEAYLKRA